MESVEEFDKERLVFVKNLNVEDVDPDDYKTYKRLTHKARMMTYPKDFTSWFIRFNNQDLEFFDFEVMDLSPYLKSTGKVTKEELGVLKMLFPEYNWDKAFLKTMRVGW